MVAFNLQSSWRELLLPPGLGPEAGLRLLGQRHGPGLQTPRGPAPGAGEWPVHNVYPGDCLFVFRWTSGPMCLRQYWPPTSVLLARICLWLADNITVSAHVMSPRGLLWTQTDYILFMHFFICTKTYQVFSDSQDKQQFPQTNINFHHLLSLKK